MLYLSSIVESPSRHRSIYFFMDLVSVPASRRHLTIFTQPKSSSENCLILFLSLWTNGKKPHFAQNLNVCSDISSFWATSFILYIIYSSSFKNGRKLLCNFRLPILFANSFFQSILYIFYDKFFC